MTLTVALGIVTIFAGGFIFGYATCLFLQERF